MEFRVLGPVEVVDGSQSIMIRAAKPRALLCVLLCSVNMPVSVDHLVDVLWDGNPPRTAAENIRLYVHQLRRSLGDAHRIVRRCSGYALLAQPAELDVARFEKLVRHGQDALEAGNPVRSARLLRAGLALWRGTPFAGLDRVTLLRDEANRMTERRQAVLEARIEADLTLGRHHDLVAELSTLVTKHPLRERLRGQLMLALYRSGRQAEALAVYRATRQLLDAELVPCQADRGR